MLKIHFSRRTWLKSVSGLGLTMVGNVFSPANAFAARQPDVLDIGSRRELFVDRFLIDKLDGTRLKLHQPTPAGKVMDFDNPWEGVYCGYTTLLQDGNLFRMYYLGYPVDPPGNFTCYAESKDGIHWTKPELGLVEFQGSKQNNILLAGLPECHNFSPFLDSKPGVPDSQRYKAVGGHAHGLMAYTSPDGIHWTKMQEEGVITQGAFDSHNLAFYSQAEQKYVCYLRNGYRRRRWVYRCTSEDFLNWTVPLPMDPGDTPPEGFYTNSTTPYFRAPHIYIALPCRCIFGKDVVSQEMKKKLGVAKGYQPKGTGYTDMPLVTSRGGNKYNRTFLETFIPGGLGFKNWTSRANYPVFGIVPTPDSDTHLSIYVNRHTGYKSAHLARYTLRYDGFASVNASYSGGEMTTRPITFQGTQLSINYATSAPGYVRVEIQDAAGQPIPGFTLADSAEIIGDELDRTVSWENGSDVSQLAGQAIRLRFVMKAADLYSLRFQSTVQQE